MDDIGVKHSIIEVIHRRLYRIDEDLDNVNANTKRAMRNPLINRKRLMELQIIMSFIKTITSNNTRTMGVDADYLTTNQIDY